MLSSTAPFEFSGGKLTAACKTQRQGKPSFAGSLYCLRITDNFRIALRRFIPLRSNSSQKIVQTSLHLCLTFKI
ncbi:hypothetical protein [Treponema zioleckii]|uniref:hypothetical protein n=1 Tax=Treponema zioleckii TaxID=331680 RepID=UPI00168ABB27|nr:hypothetical protein [Treponema zioleckii]